MRSTLQEKVYKTCTTDFNDLEHHTTTEWTKLDHAVIAAVVHHGIVVSQRVSRPAAVIWSVVFDSDIVFTGITATFLAVVDQSNSCTLTGRFGLIAVVSMTSCFAIHSNS